jgi:uncharacterized membrane protein YuzA (DUF378 family)
MKGFLGMTVWLLTIMGALIWGLDAFNYNIFGMHPLVTMPEVVKAIKIIVGVAGVLSLILFVGSLFHKHSCCCECCKKETHSHE